MTRIASLFAAGLVLLAANVSWGQNFWEPCNGAPIGSINAILTDYKGNIFVLQATRDTYGAIDAGGIYASDSTAHVWRWLTGEDFYQGEYFSCLAIDSAGTIYTNAEPSVAPYRSTDGGKTWKNISSNLPKTQIIISYVEVNTFACGRNGLLFAGMAYGVFRSSNKGNSWVRVDSGLDGDTNVTALAVDTAGTVFAATDSELFRSTDSGNVWVRVASGSFSSLTIDFKNRVLLSSGQKLYRSTNEGISWNVLSVPIPDTAIISAIATGRSGQIYIGTYSERGFQSLDDGASWLSFGSDLKDSEFSAVAINTNGDLFVGTNNSVFKSQNFGASWNSVGIGIQCAGIMPLPNGNIMAEGYGGEYGQTFLTTDEGNIWDEYPINYFNSYCTSSIGSVFISFDTSIDRSTDNGISWKIVYVEPRGVTSVVAGFDGDVFMIDEYNGIMRSTDNGDSWAIVNSIPNGFIWFSLFFSHGNLYALLGSIDGFSPASCFRSSDQGETWQEVNNSFPEAGSSFPCIGSDWKGNLYFGGPENIYRSSDSGSTWQSQYVTYGEDPIAFGNDSEGGIYSGLAGVGPPSIIRSTNNGLSWSELDVPSFQNAGAFATTPSGRIFVGTSASVFRSRDSGVAGVRERNSKNNSGLILPQNSPNPFSQSTTISFTLPSPSYISLKLFDATGRKVRALASGFFSAGEHTVDFARGTLPAGVYFYRLEAAGQSVTRAMVLSEP